MKESCCATQAAVAKTTLADQLTLYRPLIVILAMSLVSAAALSVQGSLSFMNAMMGMFLLFLSALKLFSPGSFADSFARYDLVARYWRGYALAYPFIELALGCLYLAGLFPVITNTLTVLVMLAGTMGVIQVIRSGARVQCACVGTGFNLPVGWVTLSENLAMAAMAALNLLH